MKRLEISFFNPFDVILVVNIGFEIYETPSVIDKLRVNNFTSNRIKRLILRLFLFKSSITIREGETIISSSKV